MADSKLLMADGRLVQGFATGGTGFWGIVERMTRLKAPEKPEAVITRLLGRLALRTLLLGQMPPALEWQFVHCAGPTRELTRAGFCQSPDALQCGKVALEFGPVLHDCHHGTDLAG